jgi:type IV pilus assembly protein PilZ
MMKRKGGGMRGGRMIKLNFADEETLYKSYLPFLKNGGLFYSTEKAYKLGEEVVLLLTLLNDGEKIPMAGKVVWINPKGAQGGRPAGIGIHFNNDEQGNAIDTRNKIERALAMWLKSDKKTYTM